ELGLELEAFGDGLDDEVARRQVLQMNREREPAEGGVPIVGGELALLDQLVERLLNGPLAPGEEAGLDVAGHGGEPCDRGRLRDAAAHLASAEHADAGDLSHGTSGLGLSSRAPRGILPALEPLTGKIPRGARDDNTGPLYRPFVRSPSLIDLRISSTTIPSTPAS